MIIATNWQGVTTALSFVVDFLIVYRKYYEYHRHLKELYSHFAKIDHGHVMTGSIVLYMYYLYNSYKLLAALLL